ncbi:lysophospholipid acyltransferase family protein [Methylacidimicrobium sp. B4]|uniref:lysophospholipid acyltransferase family protein n=1 Tax=Methylacidimicrobium sp. B4 TaxID=2796139 RepID=UPI001A8E907A|nr:lysophospholipid acyltransferase family protein [Methylacidimicrobium sp. B4]QSR84564.1 1-acyl-sn-glycerol-3-phosphate acyltransferase [Methylacidimicrobium sp. B4]
MRPWYAAARAMVKACLRLFFRLRGEGVERVPSGGLLLVSNHASYLDPVAVGSVVPREIYYLARRSLFRGPMAALLTSVNTIPTARERPEPAALRKILGLLAAGQGVLIFPEGTRSTDGSLQAAEPGAGFLAAQAGVPILPVRVFGSFEALPRSSRFPRLVPIRVVIGSPYPPRPIDEGEAKKDYYRSLADEMIRRIGELR